MELKEISEFIKHNNNFSSLTLRDGEFFFEMKREVVAAAAPAAAVQMAAAPAPEADAEEDLKVVESPFVGSFHELPDGKAVKEGDSVIQGQAICSIEAMKLFNEISMPESGVIVKVCAKEGDVLEFGQAIFKYRCE